MEMKKLMGVVSLAALISVQTPVFAANDATQVATQVKTQIAQGIETARMIANGGIKSSADLASKKIAGALVAKGTEGMIFNLAGPLAAALKSHPSVVVSEKTFPRLAEIAAQSEMIPTAAISSLVEAITEHGTLSESVVSAELAETSGENVANLLPGKIQAMNPETVLEMFIADNEADQALFVDSAASSDAQKARAIAVQTILVNSQLACTSNASFCAAQGKKLAALYVRDGFDQRGDAAFISNLSAGFPDEQAKGTAAQPEQYRAGGINSLEAMSSTILAGKPVTDEALAPIYGCFREGVASTKFTTAL
jgi:hypothetical protein